MADILTPLPGAPAHPRSRPGRGYVLVLIGSACFIVNAGVSRLVLDAGIGPERLSALRSCGTALVLLVVLLAAGRAPTLRLSRRELPMLLLYGVVGVALLQVTYFIAIDRLPVGIALLLEYLAPVLIALWARFVQREPVRPTIWPALGLSLVGLALVAQVWPGGSLDGFGVLMGLAAAVCFATYFLAGEHLVRRRDPLSVSFWGFAVAAAFWSLAAPWWSFDPGPLTHTAQVVGVAAPVWVLVTWVVVLGTLVPFAVEAMALRYLAATIVSVVAMIEPVGASALAWGWFGETLTVVQILGGAVVLVGIGLAQTARRDPAAD